MALAPKSDMIAATAPAETPARSDPRPPHPILDTGRDQTRDRRRQIIDAAYELLADEGLEGLTIRAVLKRTGLSRRAFYERFSGKDDLVLGVFEQTIRLAAFHYDQEVLALADPLKRLELIVTSIVLGRSSLDAADAEHDNRRGAALSREHLRLAEARPNDLQAALRPLVGLIARQLSDGMQAGLVRPYDPERLAALVYNLVSTTVHTELLTQETVQPGRAPPPQLAADIWEFCRRAIAA
jgi:AcrR family transcriptional regulator